MEKLTRMEARSLTSLQHPLVKHLVRLRTDHAYRHAHQCLLLEGLKPIQEIPVAIHKILYTSAYASYASSMRGEKWHIEEKLLHKISGMRSPEGILAEVQMPSFVSLNKMKQLLALDGVSDPGNTGTLLRTAVALGWDGAYFLPGSCDPFNEKALRASRGAHFKLALAKGTVDELHQWVKEEDVQPLVADIKGKLAETIFPPLRRLLVLGNEAHGASEAIRSFCAPVTIPMQGSMQSLNVAVAGGILLYLLRSTTPP